MLALAATDALVVSRSMSAVNPPKRIAIVRRSTMQGDELDVIFPRPHPDGVRRRSGYAYTGSLGVNQIASISLADDRVEIVNVAGPTHSLVQFALSPDGRTLVGSTEISGQLLVFSLDDPGEAAAGEVGRRRQDGVRPGVHADGRSVWVPVKSHERDRRRLDGGLDRDARDSLMPRFKQPHQIVFSPDGATAFVTNNNKMDHMADPAHAGHADAGRREERRRSRSSTSRRGSVSKAIPLGKNLTGMGRRLTHRHVAPSAVAARGDAGARRGGARRRGQTGCGRPSTSSAIVAPFKVLDRAGREYALPFLGGLDVPRPQFVDIDADGDLDLFVQEYQNAIWFFENTGIAAAPRYEWRTDRYQDLDTGEWYRFVDIDADGDVDLVGEQPFSNIRLYRNIGTTAAGEVRRRRDAAGRRRRSRCSSIARTSRRSSISTATGAWTSSSAASRATSRATRPTRPAASGSA